MDSSNNDVMFDAPVLISVASNDNAGGAENLMLLTNVEPIDVMLGENKFVIFSTRAVQKVTKPIFVQHVG